MAKVQRNGHTVAYNSATKEPDARAKIIPASWDLTPKQALANIVSAHMTCSLESRAHGRKFFPMVASFCQHLAYRFNVNVERVVAAFVVASTGTRLHLNMVNTVAGLLALQAGELERIESFGIRNSGRDKNATYAARIAKVLAADDPIGAVTEYRNGPGSRPLAPKFALFTEEILHALGIVPNPEFKTVDVHLCEIAAGTHDAFPDAFPVRASATAQQISNITPPQAGYSLPMLYRVAQSKYKVDVQALWAEATGWADGTGRLLANVGHRRADKIAHEVYGLAIDDLD